MTMAMSRLDQFLAELRAILAEGEACDEGVDVTAFSEKLKRHIELVDAHNDGAKMMCTSGFDLYCREAGGGI